MSIKTIVGVRAASFRIGAALTLSASAWLLTGCGQKGPLFLPPPPTAGKPAKAAPTSDTRNNQTVEELTLPER